MYLRIRRFRIGKVQVAGLAVCEVPCHTLKRTAVEAAQAGPGTERTNFGQCIFSHNSAQTVTSVPNSICLVNDAVVMHKLYQLNRACGASAAQL